jgi:hypothetical protein
MVQVIEEYLLSLTETSTAELLKIIYPDLRPKSPNIYNPTDYVSDKAQVDLELKNRNDGFYSYLIEKDKYDKLMLCDTGYYISVGANGIFCWDVKKFTNENNLNWRYDKYSKTTEFKNRKKVDKLVDYWSISEAENLTAVLLLHPFLYTNNKNPKKFMFDFMKY